jgi:hypothetical protein
LGRSTTRQSRLKQKFVVDLNLLWLLFAYRVRCLAISPSLAWFRASGVFVSAARNVFVRQLMHSVAPAEFASSYPRANADSAAAARTAGGAGAVRDSRAGTQACDAYTARFPHIITIH